MTIRIKSMRKIQIQGLFELCDWSTNRNTVLVMADGKFDSQCSDWSGFSVLVT